MASLACVKFDTIEVLSIMLAGSREALLHSAAGIGHTAARTITTLDHSVGLVNAASRMERVYQHAWGVCSNSFAFSIPLSLWLYRQRGPTNKKGIIYLSPEAKYRRTRK